MIYQIAALDAGQSPESPIFGTNMIAEKDLEKHKQKNSVVIITIGRIAIQKRPDRFAELAQRFVKNTKYKFIWVEIE